MSRCSQNSVLWTWWRSILLRKISIRGHLSLYLDWSSPVSPGVKKGREAGQALLFDGGTLVSHLHKEGHHILVHESWMYELLICFEFIHILLAISGTHTQITYRQTFALQWEDVFYKMNSYIIIFKVAWWYHLVEVYFENFVLYVTFSHVLNFDYSVRLFFSQRTVLITYFWPDVRRMKKEPSSDRYS